MRVGVDWIQHARGARAADALLGRIDLRLVQKAPDPLTRAGFDHGVRHLALHLLDAIEQPEIKTATAVRAALDVNWGKLDAKGRERALKQAEQIVGDFGSRIGPSIQAILAAEGKNIIGVVKDATIGKWELPIAATFGKQDERIVAHAASSQALFVTNQYGMRAVALSGQARTIVADGLDKGLDRYEIGDALQAAIGVQLGRSDSYFPMVASVFMARARSWSVLSSFEEAGIESWKFSSVLDERTCFAKGTRVLLGDGSTYAPIESLRVGDVVMSCRGRPRRVTAIIRTPSRKWGQLALDDSKHRVGPLVLTPSHGMLSSKGWMRGQVIVAGDRLVRFKLTGPDRTSELWSDYRTWGMRRGRHDPRTIDVHPYPHPYLDKFAPFVDVRSLVWTSTSRTEDAHDIEVDEDHGYVAEGVVVHNSNICRYLDGQTFDVASSANRFRQVADSADPEDVRALQPFVRESGGSLYVGTPGEKDHFAVAKVEESAFGKKDERGTFSGGASPKSMQARGISAPPLHPYCRSELVPGDGPSGAVQVPEQVGPAQPPPPPPPPPKPPKQPAAAPPAPEATAAPPAAPPPRPAPDSLTSERAMATLDKLPATDGQIAVKDCTGLKAPPKTGPLRPYDDALAKIGKDVDALIADHGERFSWHAEKSEMKTVQATARTLDREAIAAHINTASKDPVVIVRSGGDYYLHSGAEVVAASHLRIPGYGKQLFDGAVLVDLDKLTPAARPEMKTWAAQLSKNLGSSTADAGTAVREALREQLRGMGVVTRDDRRGGQPGVDHWHALPRAGAGVNDYATKPDNSTDLIGADAYHGWDGRMRTRKSVNSSATDRLREFGQKGEDWPQELKRRGFQAEDFSRRFDGIRVLLHEEAHGASKALGPAYRGIGVGMEEAATEMIARKGAREVLGFKDHTEAFRLPVKSSAGPYKGGEECYREYIEGVFNAVAKHTGDDNIHKRIEDAFVATRRWGKGEVYQSPADQVADFVANLGKLPKDVAAKLAEELNDPTGFMAKR